ncbi:MAG: CoA-binding domain protein, partial [Planctomycetaceae bacterium]|nr:CoA-binding domain protein [Planctomycetaceae bacterium]
MIDFDQLNAIFRPDCVAVVGASDRPGTVGHDVYANLKAANFTGRLIPVNRLHSQVQGDVAWGALSDVPVTPDLVVVCTPAATVPEIARCCGERGVRGMIVISAGFRESGPAGQKLEIELRRVLHEYPRLRMIGPNCLGVLAPHSRLNASFSGTMPRPGKLAVISQSGALCTAILDSARDCELGVSACVSVGNMLDIGMGDLIDYFAADEHTSAIMLYIEALTDPRHFIAAASACSRTKPIVALKSGRFPASSQAASSHTGAMAGVDTVYEAALRRAGIERVFSLDELFDCARLLVDSSPATGSQLAIVTNAGGPGVMATDAWLARRGQLARLSAQTMDELNLLLPQQWSHSNPVDVLGDAHPARFSAALEIVMRDPQVDSVIVMLTPQSMTNPSAIAEAIAQSRFPISKPLLAVWMGGPAVRPGRLILEAAGIPVFATPEQAVNALSHVTSVGTLRKQSVEAPSMNDQMTTGPLVKLPDGAISNAFAQKITA